MDFNTFKNNLVILNSTERNEVRNKYINSFVDISGEFYKLNIERKIKFIDGYCYKSYLWDCLISPVVISQDYIKKASENLKEVYVLWDIHSCERIFIEDYWKFEKDAVLSLDIKLLLSGLELLPEDIYVFDDCFDWTLIFTHENIKDDRYCLKAGNI